MSATRFIILCAARTGSTMLRHQLTSHPEICCHGEVMTSAAMRSFVGLDDKAEPPLAAKLLELRQRDPVGFMNEFVLFAGTKRAVGFKIKYEELVLPEWQAVLNALLADTELKVIHLTRRNRLKRVISKITATKVNRVYNVLKSGDLPTRQRLRVSPQECIADFKEVAEREEKFRNLFGHEKIESVYEELVEPNTGELERIQSFLGVAPQPLPPQTLKINPDTLSDILENYDELKRELSPQYGAFFQ
jgi:LPS sulfotransferase NodH